MLAFVKWILRSAPSAFAGAVAFMMSTDPDQAMPNIAKWYSHVGSPPQWLQNPRIDDYWWAVAALAAILFAWACWATWREVGKSAKGAKEIPRPAHGFISLQDAWKTDFETCMKTSSETSFGTVGDDRPPVSVPWHVCMDFQAANKFVSFYLPDVEDVEGAYRALVEMVPHVLKSALGGLGISGKVTGDSVHTDAEDLSFSGRVFVYSGAMISPRTLANVTDLFKQAGMQLVVRGSDYVTMRMLGARAKAA